MEQNYTGKTKNQKSTRRPLVYRLARPRLARPEEIAVEPHRRLIPIQKIPPSSGSTEMLGWVPCVLLKEASKNMLSLARLAYC